MSLLHWFEKPTSDGRKITVYPLTYDRARIGIGQRVSATWFDDVW